MIYSWTTSCSTLPSLGKIKRSDQLSSTRNEHDETFDFRSLLNARRRLLFSLAASSMPSCAFIPTAAFTDGARFAWQRGTRRRAYSDSTHHGSARLSTYSGWRWRRHCFDSHQNSVSQSHPHFLYVAKAAFLIFMCWPRQHLTMHFRLFSAVMVSSTLLSVYREKAPYAKQLCDVVGICIAAYIFYLLVMWQQMQKADAKDSWNFRDGLSY